MHQETTFQWTLRADIFDFSTYLKPLKSSKPSATSQDFPLFRSSLNLILSLYMHFIISYYYHQYYYCCCCHSEFWEKCNKNSHLQIFGWFKHFIHHISVNYLETFQDVQLLFCLQRIEEVDSFSVVFLFVVALNLLFMTRYQYLSSLLEMTKLNLFKNMSGLSKSLWIQISEFQLIFPLKFDFELDFSKCSLFLTIIIKTLNRAFLFSADKTPQEKQVCTF